MVNICYMWVWINTDVTRNWVVESNTHRAAAYFSFIFHMSHRSCRMGHVDWLREVLFHRHGAELSFLRRSAEAGDSASVPAATCWGNPPAGVWSHGAADPSIPVAQERRPSPKCHKEETDGEVVSCVLFCYEILELTFAVLFSCCCKWLWLFLAHH